jgi:hypothetical protein
VLDQADGQVSQQRFAMGFFTAQVVDFVSVTHDLLFFTGCTVSGIAAYD